MRAPRAGARVTFLAPAHRRRARRFRYAGHPRDPASSGWGNVQEEGAHDGGNQAQQRQAIETAREVARQVPTPLRSAERGRRTLLFQAALPAG